MGLAGYCKDLVFYSEFGRCIGVIQMPFKEKPDAPLRTQCSADNLWISAPSGSAFSCRAVSFEVMPFPRQPNFGHQERQVDKGQAILALAGHLDKPRSL